MNTGDKDIAKSEAAAFLLQHRDHGSPGGAQQGAVERAFAQAADDAEDANAWGVCHDATIPKLGLPRASDP